MFGLSLRLPLPVGWVHMLHRHGYRLVAISHRHREMRDIRGQGRFWLQPTQFQIRVRVHSISVRQLRISAGWSSCLEQMIELTIHGEFRFRRSRQGGERKPPHRCYMDYLVILVVPMHAFIQSIRQQVRLRE